MHTNARAWVPIHLSQGTFRVLNVGPYLERSSSSIAWGRLGTCADESAGMIVEVGAVQQGRALGGWLGRRVLRGAAPEQHRTG